MYYMSDWLHSCSAQHDEFDKEGAAAGIVKEELLSEFFVCNDLGRDEMFYARVKRSLNKLYREGYVGVC